ncbi:NADP(H)-dependent aldo-keto reductase [Flavobacterium sp. WW92]|uniref:NADP(H)-dependent aldo-keto reductase n=1 Tax=unclassified Flavobacterium TaxID=196869 RepID=UPI0022251EEA|nr:MULTISPECIES: NADP(H)-dependent aldo-keto reductase [unclassified Flavobacterium]WDO13975.1 NADP(H)-dependent aldo-keto reductase [Flavobacterium sp. WW92]
MNYNTLPNTNLKVSEICLGTMTFGQQNTEADGHSQLDFALDKGINFIDTAEMYPVPAREKTTGDTERIIGSWLQKSGKRNDIVLATKIAGPNRGMPYVREDMAFTAETLKLSVEKSLERLHTDYIDLYQLHWPERKSNMFGQRGFKIQEDAWEDNIQSVLEALQELIQDGKIRAIGVSNETPWGVMRFLEESKKHNLPRISTIQNPYSLLNRTFEVGLSETAYRENVGLLAYSPLAFGTLSGKFLTGEEHPNARLNLFPNFTRYNSQQTKEATKLYQETATRFGLTLTEMSLAFIRQQQFVTATIVGATNLKQLEENINTVGTVLSEEMLKAIDEIQAIRPNPAP